MIGGERITLTFGFNTLDAAVALRRIDVTLSSSNAGKSGFLLSGTPVKDFAEAFSRLKKRERTTFKIVGEAYEFDLGRIKNNHLDFLIIDHRGKHDFLCDQWAMPFLGDHSFVMAWLADSNYQYWQNAYDPLQYKGENRPFEHLPMKSNGLPYPLEQTIIDTSSNPGRFVIRDGYYEAVGAVMWLGEPFWQLTGADREAVERADWLQVSHPTATVMRIQAAGECFKGEEGSSRELQVRLRSLLFPRTVSAVVATPPKR